MAQILPRFYQARVDIAALKRLKADFDADPEAFVTMRAPGDRDKARGVRSSASAAGAADTFPGPGRTTSSATSSGYAPGYVRGGVSGTSDTDDSRNHAGSVWPCELLWPREESNLRARIRSPLLYPLSYGARKRSVARRRVRPWTGPGSRVRRAGPRAARGFARSRH
jgi:hypothetical protein